MFRFSFFGAALALLSFGSSAALDAASISGIVLDPQGEIVANAVIRAHDIDTGALVSSRGDGAGNYELTGLGDGTYLLEFGDDKSALTASGRVRIHGDVRNHDVMLEMKTLETVVVVTAAGTPTANDETAKAVSVITSDEIAKRHEFSIGESVRNVPGVRVQQLRGPGSLTTIQTRGLRNQDTALLIDGLRFRDAAGGQGDASSILQDFLVVDADRLEFVRGSGSSLYGSHAMGGVLNIQSATGGGRPHGEISIDGGGLGSARGLARFGGGLMPLNRLIYSGGISHLNVTQGVDGYDPYRNTSGQGYVRYSFTPDISLSGRFYGGDSFGASNESPTFVDAVTANHPASGPIPAIGLPVEQVRRFSAGQPISPGNATFVPDFNDPDGSRAGGFVSFATVFQHQVAPDRSYRLSYQLVDTTRSFRDGPGGVGSFEPRYNNDGRFDGRIDTFQARTDFSAGQRQMITMGYEYEREEYLDVNSDGNPDASARFDSTSSIEQNSHAVFAQDQLRVGDFQVALSGRVQTFNLQRPSFAGGQNPYSGADTVSPSSAYTGDVSLAYFLRGSNTKLRAHGGTAYRAPAPFERFGASFFQGFPSFWGDPNLAPERSAAFDAGIDQWFANGKVQLSATYFYTELNEIILFDFGVIDPGTDSWGRFGGFRNSGGGLARGFEFGVSASPTTSTMFKSAYTYTNSDSRSPTVPGVDYFKVMGVSDHMFSMTLIQNFGRRFDLSFDFFALSGYPLRLFGANNRLMFEGPVKADVVFGYSLPIGEHRNIKLFGKVENLFDRRYFEDGFAAPGVWAVGGLKFSF
jgi:vitamin B12 transporter